MMEQTSEKRFHSYLCFISMYNTSNNIGDNNSKTKLGIRNDESLLRSTYKSDKNRHVFSKEVAKL